MRTSWRRGFWSLWCREPGRQRKGSGGFAAKRRAQCLQGTALSYSPRARGSTFPHCLVPHLTPYCYRGPAQCQLRTNGGRTEPWGGGGGHPWERAVNWGRGGGGGGRGGEGRGGGGGGQHPWEMAVNCGQGLARGVVQSCPPVQTLHLCLIMCPVKGVPRCRHPPPDALGGGSACPRLPGG